MTVECDTCLYELEPYTSEHCDSCCGAHSNYVPLTNKANSVCEGLNYVLENIGITGGVFIEDTVTECEDTFYYFHYSIDVHSEQCDNYFQGRLIVSKTELLTVSCDVLVRSMYLEIVKSLYDLVGWKYGRNDYTISHNGIDSISN